MYQALYRKWRPRVFDDVVGQNHITETLKRQVAEGKLSHAYLFTGSRGTGKTTCAKILARAVNCAHPVDGNPCNACPACLGIESGAVMEVVEMDAATNNGVDQIRSLREEAVYSPAAVRRRVYIIDEAHMVTPQAFNALLKILEEPPEHLMFIFATTEANKILPTIKSRCQQFAFKRISPADIAHRLMYVAEQENIPITQEGANLLAHLADGGMRDALSLLDQCAAGQVMDKLGEREILDTLGLAGNLETAALMREIAAHNTGAALERLDRLYNNGKDIAGLLNELIALTRDLLISKAAPQGGVGLLTGGYDSATLEELSAKLSLSRLTALLRQLQQTAAGLNRSANRRVDAELSLIRLCDETLDESPAGLNARVTRLETLVAERLSAEPPQNGGAARVPSETAPPTGERKMSEESVSPAESFWPRIVAELHGRVPMAEYSFFSNPSAVQGVFQKNALTLWVRDDFTKMMVTKPEILAAVKERTASLPGGPYPVNVAVGIPPAHTVPAAPTNGSQKIDDLLALGRQFGDIITEEHTQI